MPIQIPRIQADAAEPALNAPRLQAPNLDPVTPMKGDTAAIEGVAKDAIRLHQEIQHQEADNTATNNSNDYNIWRKKRIYGDPETGWKGYANMTGANPKDLYAQFDKEEEEYLNKASAPKEGEDWSAETQNLVNRRLSRHYELNKLETLTQYSHQKTKWDDSNDNVRVKLAQQGMYGASSLVDAADPTSFGGMEAQIAEIRNTGIARGLRNMGAMEDPNGGTSYNDGSGPKSVKLSQNVKYEIAKNISDGISDATKNLLDSNDLDKAKALHDWADENGYLDIQSKKNLTGKFQKAQFEKEAAHEADLAIKAGSPASLDKIDDPQMRLKAKKLFNEEQHLNDQTQDLKYKQNFNAGSKQVDQVMNSGQPYPGIEAMKNDPVIKKIWDNMNAKGQQALEHQVKAPQQTSPSVQAKWLNIVTGQAHDADGNVISLKGMSQPDLAMNTAGMKDTDKKAAIATWTKMNSQTGPQIEQQYKAFGKEFDQQAIGAKLLQKIPNSNLLIGPDQIRSQVFKKELLDSIDSLGPVGPKERSEYVAKFIADKKADLVFTPPAKAKMNGGGNNNPPAAPPTGTEPAPVTPKTDPSKYMGNLKEAQRMQGIMDYRKQPGMQKAIPSDAQLADFLLHQKSNK